MSLFLSWLSSSCLLVLAALQLVHPATVEAILNFQKLLSVGPNCLRREVPLFSASDVEFKLVPVGVALGWRFEFFVFCLICCSLASLLIQNR